MKYSLTLLSVLGLNLGLTLAQDAQSLMAVGFPECAVPCIQAGNKAAADKHGCGLTDGVCQCTTGYKTAQEAVMSCITSTLPCNDVDMKKIGVAGASLCVNNKQSGPSNGTSTATTAKPSASNSDGGAKPAAGPTSTKNAAAAERTLAAGLVGLAALAWAL